MLCWTALVSGGPLEAEDPAKLRPQNTANASVTSLCESSPYPWRRPSAWSILVDDHHGNTVDSYSGVLPEHDFSIPTSSLSAFDSAFDEWRLATSVIPANLPYHGDLGTSSTAVALNSPPSGWDTVLGGSGSLLPAFEIDGVVFNTAQRALDMDDAVKVTESPKDIGLSRDSEYDATKITEAEEDPGISWDFAYGENPIRPTRRGSVSREVKLSDASREGWITLEMPRDLYADLQSRGLPAEFPKLPEGVQVTVSDPVGVDIDWGDAHAADEESVAKMLAEYVLLDGAGVLGE
ncbi:hypothetical protein SISNIDRAFT_470643 [Sistotremastrum niveocremeum HHB9708]|uniref:Uncharacterized protein n=1 Tax=Sistotremastrum niveocremeum HHB9708 TaxID=1314777 RepID=A0A164NP66_9AGAM|nr:hypothetical protein SISNIDRAFT_470643 [Sistotremastrum niveocremeum HHB9708]